MKITPPHNIEAEEALIGSILIDPDMFGEFNLSPDVFYIVKNKWIWEAFTQLAAQRHPIDLLTVQEELSRRGQLEEVGGPAYLTRLVTLVPMSFNAHGYAALVDEAATRRKLIKAAGEVAKLAYDVKTDISVVKEAAVKAVIDGAETQAKDTLQPIAQLAANLADKVNEGNLSGNLLKTGLAPLDANIGGFDLGTLNLIAGRPGMSKTSFLLQVADLVSERGDVVAFFSMEMSREQCLLRLACRRAHISVQSLRNGQATTEERELVAQWLNWFTNRKTLYIDGSMTQTTRGAMSECRKLERRAGRIALVIADHLRLFADPEINEVKRLGQISRACKVLAGELNTRSLVAVQLNRGTEKRDEDDRDPTMADIRGSGQIEEDADVILGLNRPDYYAKTGTDRTVKITSLKLRDGDASATTYMDFYGEYMGFEKRSKPQ